MPRHKKGIGEAKAFMATLFLLYVAQIFIVVPGSNVDASAYGNYQTITFMGLSYSAWLSLIVLAWCLARILIAMGRIRLTRPSIVCLISIVGFMGIGAATSDMSGLADVGIKMLMPFVLYFYLRYVLVWLGGESIDRLLLAINLFLVGQVLVCKVLTGEFSANHYYTYIMEEEYFGYYNNPHPFTAMLGLLSIWNLRIIAYKKAPLVNVALLAANIVLIFVSGVRTYLVGLVFAIALIMLMALFKPELKRFRIPLLIGLVILLFIGGNIMSLLSGTRFDSSFNSVELTSGRIERWTVDFEAYCSGDLFEILFGGGFAYSYVVNGLLIGVSINSLNFIIDLLLDNGLLGCLALLVSYVAMLSDLIKRSRGTFVVALLSYLLVGMMLNNLLPYVTVTLSAILVLFSWERDGEMTKPELEEKQSESARAEFTSVSSNSGKRQMVGRRIY